MPADRGKIDQTSHQVGSTLSAGQSVDQGRGRIFPCEGCGADFTFHIGQQQLKCPYCGFEKVIELSADAEIVEQDFHAALTRLKETRLTDESAATQSEVRCAGCGAVVVFFGTLTSSECPYCASPIQRDKVHTSTDRIPVDGVLPFQISEEEAQANLTRWVKSRWFAPNDFIRRGVSGKMSGVYLPFWTFDTLTGTQYSGQRGEHYWVTVGSGKHQRRVRRTRWYPAYGAFERFFDDVLVLAARGMRRNLMQQLEPWPLPHCAPFNQQMLAGFLARTYDVDLEEGFDDAKGRIDRAIEQDVRHRIGGDAQRVHSINTSYNAIRFKHLLLPVWLFAYRFKGNVYQVMINAGTGEVQGERPYSWVKITLSILGVALVSAAIALVLSHS